MTRRPPSAPRSALDADALERLALGYVGRYATSRAGLARYLARKIAERGWKDDAPPADIEALADRLVTLGYVDDRALAEACGRSLARRGYGARRLAAALDGLGIDGDARREAVAAAEAGAWEAALRFAERRRLGPFAETIAGARARARAFAAMLRAGHQIDHVQVILATPPGAVPERDA